MAVRITSYIGFAGEAAKALAFYHGVLGGSLEITRYSDMPMEGMGGQPDWVMHGQLDVSEGVAIMAADSEGERGGSRIDVILYGDDADELRRAFDGLSAGGNVTMPFDQAPWGSYFGQFTDRFGVGWMIEGGQAG
ncbi:VOC family protein [Microbacterium excoecariae]|uniref:VOC family protein n=1 Tax=Microbacterium excoecariae TaxID=2715210 RepID=UPI00140D117A|nr:VOC family protein [Microbacterium excoecariae]NHI15943.1 VOC family protein [Microbacterium excoecariae]